jgi:hypothetical protein
LQLDGKFVHGVQYSNAGAVTIATVQEILLENGFQNAFDSNLQQLILGGWNA